MSSMQVIVRYTFLDIAEPQNGSLRRSGSTPASTRGALADKLLDFGFNEGGETRLCSASTATTRGFSPKTRRSSEVFSGRREGGNIPQQSTLTEDSTGGTCNAAVAGGDSGSTLGHGSQVASTQLKLGGDEEDEIKKPTNVIPNSTKLKTVARDEDQPVPVAPLWRQPPQSSAALTQEQRLQRLNALDLCDIKARPAAHSRATTKGQQKPIQPRWLLAAEAAQQTAVTEPPNLFGGSLRKIEPTKRRNAFDDVSPFTSDEELEPIPHQTKSRALVTLATAAKPSRVFNAVDLEEWPDTDDEFEKSMALDGAPLTTAASAQPQQVFPTWTADGEVMWEPCHPCAALAPAMAPAPTPLRLNRDAKMFSPAPPAVAEFQAVVANVKVALLSTGHVLCVEVKEDPSCTTMFISLMDDGDLGCSDFATKVSATIQNSKEALLNAAALTQGTYVFGYAKEAFRGIAEEGFEATLAHCPPNKEEKACWETFQNGACPRQGTCRWYHPRASDKRKIRVVIEED